VRHEFRLPADSLDVSVREFVGFVAASLATACDRNVLGGDVVIAFHNRSTQPRRSFGIRAMDLALMWAGWPTSIAGLLRVRWSWRRLSAVATVIQ
jgi:hypothetical protein